MAPRRFTECLAILGWSAHGLTRMVDCSPGLVRGWVSGERSIPPAIAAWLERRVAMALDNPPPQDWRRPRFGGARLANRAGDASDDGGLSAP